MVKPGIFWCFPCLLSLSELLITTRNQYCWETRSFSFFQVWRILCEGCSSCRWGEIRLFCIWCIGKVHSGFLWYWSRRIGSGPIWSITRTWSTLCRRRFRRNIFVCSKCKKSLFRIVVCTECRVFQDLFPAGNPCWAGCSFCRVYWRIRIGFWKAGASLRGGYWM